MNIFEEHNYHCFSRIKKDINKSQVYVLEVKQKCDSDTDNSNLSNCNNKEEAVIATESDFINRNIEQEVNLNDNK